MSVTRPILTHLHLFKNAGTSVDRCLRHNFGDRWGSIDRQPADGQLTAREVANFLEEHQDLVAISSHHLRPPLSPVGAISFIPIVFLRHPLDRIASAYTFEKRQDGSSPSSAAALEYDLAGWIDFHNAKGSVQCSNFQTMMLSTDRHEDGRLVKADDTAGHLTRARNFLLSLPAFGLVESYRRSWEALYPTISPLHPSFQVVITRENATARNADLAARLNRIEMDLGVERYRELELANAADLELHAWATQYFVERIATGQHRRVELPPEHPQNAFAVASGFGAMANDQGQTGLNAEQDSSLRSERERLEAEVATALEQRQSIQADLSAQKEELKESSARLEEVRAELARLNDQRKDLTARIGVLEDQLREKENISKTGGPGTRLPNLLYIGMGQSGSSLLYQMFRRHPDVFVSPKFKEVNFFGNNQRWNAGLDWYRECFQECGDEQWVADISSGYHIKDRTRVRMLETLGTDLKLIFTFRRFTDFAYSRYLEKARSSMLDASFLDELEGKGNFLRPLDELLAAQFETFGRENFLIMHYESDFDRANPQFEEKICDFLGLKQETSLDQADEDSGVSSSVVPRFVWSGDEVYEEEMGGVRYLVPPKTLVYCNGRGNQNRHWTDPNDEVLEHHFAIQDKWTKVMDAALYEHVQTNYTMPLAERVSAKLGIDLSHWEVKPQETKYDQARLPDYFIAQE